MNDSSTDIGIAIIFSLFIICAIINGIFMLFTGMINIISSHKILFIVIGILILTILVNWIYNSKIKPRLRIRSLNKEWAKTRHFQLYKVLEEKKEYINSRLTKIVERQKINEEQLSSISSYAQSKVPKVALSATGDINRIKKIIEKRKSAVMFCSRAIESVNFLQTKIEHRKREFFNGNTSDIDGDKDYDESLDLAAQTMSAFSEVEIDLWNLNKEDSFATDPYYSSFQTAEELSKKVLRVKSPDLRLKLSQIHKLLN